MTYIYEQNDIIYFALNQTKHVCKETCPSIKILPLQSTVIQNKMIVLKQMSSAIKEQL